jgi:PadR family transcriptional regulator, regulatory protein PadR
MFSWLAKDTYGQHVSCITIQVRIKDIRFSSKAGNGHHIYEAVHYRRGHEGPFFRKDLIPKFPMYWTVMYIYRMKQNNQLFKGSLTTIVLKLLGEQDKMYGYEITKKVKELTGGEVNITEGALYPALHKLEADGLLTVSIENIGNRPRKYYTLTKAGKKEAKNKLAEIKDFFQQMQLLLNLELTNR